MRPINLSYLGSEGGVFHRNRSYEDSRRIARRELQDEQRHSRRNWQKVGSDETAAWKNGKNEVGKKKLRRKGYDAGRPATVESRIDRARNKEA